MERLSLGASGAGSRFAPYRRRVNQRHLPLDLRALFRRRTQVIGSLSEPLSDEDIEALYRDIVLTPDFYGPGYDLDLLAAPRRGFADLAASIVSELHPARTLDVGCGIGALVSELRQRGVDAHGSDFSTTFIDRARRRARPYITQQDVTALGFPDGSFDLVICMEVLEHLPARVIDLALAELSRVSRGAVLVTTPSFGDDPNGGLGLPIGEPSWQADAAAGRRFGRIVLDDEGRPHLGTSRLPRTRGGPSDSSPTAWCATPTPNTPSSPTRATAWGAGGGTPTSCARRAVTECHTFRLRTPPRRVAQM